MVRYLDLNIFQPDLLSWILNNKHELILLLVPSGQVVVFDLESHGSIKALRKNSDVESVVQLLD